MSGGSTSNAWRVWTDTRDAYICCRDNMGEIKISLHGSGKQHIAFRSETGIEMTPGSRFWNQWHEPPQQDPAIPSFKLVFPPWGVRLTEEREEKDEANQGEVGRQPNSAGRGRPAPDRRIIRRSR